MSLQSFKAATRKEVAGRLSNLEFPYITEVSKQTAQSITSLSVFQNAKSIALYMHLPDIEIHTNYIINESFKLNKKIYLPRIEKLSKFNDYQNFPSQKSCLHFLSVESQSIIDNLKPRGKYQIREPEYTAQNSNDLLLNNEKLDIIFLPGVAFTQSGKRLGHGAGFYDDFIKRYQSHHQNTQKPTLIGISLPEQIVDDNEKFVVEDHDEFLDYIIAGSSIYKCQN